LTPKTHAAAGEVSDLDANIAVIATLSFFLLLLMLPAASLRTCSAFPLAAFPKSAQAIDVNKQQPGNVAGDIDSNKLDNNDDNIDHDDAVVTKDGLCLWLLRLRGRTRVKGCVFAPDTYAFALATA